MDHNAAQLLAAGHTRYALQLDVVDLSVDNHQHCPICQNLGSVVEAEVYLPLEAGDGHLSTKHVECCCSCVLATIDREPHLAVDQTITVEVYRGASFRVLA
jgi:hypothetical protein